MQNRSPNAEAALREIEILHTLCSVQDVQSVVVDRDEMQPHLYKAVVKFHFREIVFLERLVVGHTKVISHSYNFCFKLSHV